MRLRPRPIVALVLATLALSACAPQREPLDTAIPAAFLASDLGITAAEAGTSMDGFSLNVTASAEFDPDAAAPSADDLRTMLRLVVENTPQNNVNTLEIYGSVGPYEGGNAIDFGALGVELGFEDDNPLSGFSAPWDDVVELLDQ